jgi:hypothetical protein
MNFKKLFERPKSVPEKTPDQLPDAELLEKLRLTRVKYDNIARHWNYARNPSPHILREFPGIENSSLRDDIIKETDEELQKARQELRKIEEEVRRRKLPEK